MVTPMHNATHASRDRSGAGAFVRILSAAALTLTALVPASMAGMLDTALADGQVMGPHEHLAVELDYGRANTGLSPFALFTANHDDPVSTEHNEGRCLQ